MTARRSWKAWESRVAKRLNGKRIPVTGIDRHGSDVDTALFVIQCKLRAGQPAYLRQWLDGIVATARDRQRVGVVIWKEPGAQHEDDDALVVMRLKDFQDLHGKV